MKQSTIFSRILMLGLVLMLVLVACEKPTPGAEEQEKNAQATQEAIEAGAPETVPATPVPATAVPNENEVIAPEGEAATAVPGEAPEGETPAGETPAGEGDTSPAVDPTADPNAGGGTDGGTSDGGTTTTPVTPVPAGGTYTVSAGENFFRIGLNHGCTVDQMAAVNPAVVPPDYIIYIGQVLTIPSCP